MAVFSEDLVRENIWDSMYNRHTYASTGARALLYFLIRDAAASADLAIRRKRNEGKKDSPMHP
jgi:hypothetical protein